MTRRDEVILTRQDLEDGGEEEAAALDQTEQLVEEGDEGEEAEEDGEDHEGLDCLDPVWRSRETGEEGQLLKKHIQNFCHSTASAILT